MVSLPEILCVAIGGALGATLRFLVGRGAEATFPPLLFPAATFFINVLGCLLIGITAALSTRGMTSHEMRLIIVVGILGGFTTFSAFGLETVSLLRGGHFGLATMYVFGSVLGGVGAVTLGLRLAEK